MVPRISGVTQRYPMPKASSESAGACRSTANRSRGAAAGGATGLRTSRTVFQQKGVCGLGFKMRTLLTRRSLGLWVDPRPSSPKTVKADKRSILSETPRRP